MKKTVRKTESGYPLMRYLSLLLVVALLFSGVTFARYALERSGSVNTDLARFDASYTVEGVNSLTFGNSYYWKDEGNRWYEQGSARTVRIKMKNNSDVNVRANVLHMEGPAEFWENIALQLVATAADNSVAAGDPLTTQYVLADLLRVRTGGKDSNGNDPIYDADGNKATHQYEYGAYINWDNIDWDNIDWDNNPPVNGAKDGVFNTGFSDEFGQRGNVEESLQMSGGITAGWAEGDNTFDLSRVTSFSGTVTAVRQSASASATDLTKMPLTITITASMKEEVPYSVGFARRQEQRSLPAFYLDCEKKVPYYEIDITLPEADYFNMTAKSGNMESGGTTSVIAFLTWTNSLQSTDLTTNVYRGSTDELKLNWGGLTDGTDELNWKDLTDGTQPFNGAEVVGYHFNYNDVPATQDDEDILTTVRMNYKIGDTSPTTWQHVASISSEDGVYAHALELKKDLELKEEYYQCTGDNPVTIAKEAVEACGGIYGTHFQENDFLWSEDDDASTPDFCLASEKGYQVTFSVSFVQSSELPE